MIEKSRIDQYFKYAEVIAQAKKYMKEVEVEILEEAAVKLSSSKEKTFRFFGNGQNCLTVTEQETTVVLSYELLKSFLGEKLSSEFITKTEKYKLESMLAKILSPVASGKFTEVSLYDAVETVAIAAPDAAKAMLHKKIKGEYAKDLKILDVLTLATKEEKETYAYLIEEAANFDRICALLKMLGYTPETAEFDAKLAELKTLLIVDTVLKIGNKPTEE